MSHQKIKQKKKETHKQQNTPSNHKTARRKKISPHYSLIPDMEQRIALVNDRRVVRI